LAAADSKASSDWRNASATRLQRRAPRPLRAWLPALAWIALIAWGSTETFSGHHTYGWLLRFWQREGWPLESVPYVNYVLRKIGHFCVYGALSVLLFIAWRETLRARWRQAWLMWSPRLLLLALAGTVLVAAADEFHQSFVPGRTGVAHDVVLDSFGAICAQMILLTLLYARRAKPRG
jgi:VanZ family protein